MAGANPGAVQRILRHGDPRLTMDVYGHLLPGYLHDEIDWLRFNVESSESPEVAASPTDLVTSFYRPPLPSPHRPSTLLPNPRILEGLARYATGDSNARPSAPEADALSS
jgi:hypothetical protein